MFGQKKNYLISKELAGKRADIAVSLMESDVSRQYLQKLFDLHVVMIGGKPLKRSYKVKENDLIVIEYPNPIKLNIEPVDRPIDIVYEDEYLLVVNKEAGVVVHPTYTGNHLGESLVNALMFHIGDHFAGIGGVLRPGIVHRLDKDTSGLIIIAKTDITHRTLVKMFKERKIKKKYLALVSNNIKEDTGIIEAPIGRNRSDRKKMSIDGIHSKEAITEFTVLDRFEYANKRYTLLDILLRTGRTHQIRVHFKHIGNPLVGDIKYGNTKLNNIFLSKFNLHRQFLHAYFLQFKHPETKKEITIEIPLSLDLENVLKKLKLTKN